MAQTTDDQSLIPAERSLAEQETGAVAAQAREKWEIAARMELARRYPRVENDCRRKMLELCDRPSFAKRARYRYPRGRCSECRGLGKIDGTRCADCGGTGKNYVEGLAVYSSRQMERFWGNIMSATRILAEDDQHVHVQCMSVDLETNTWKFQEGKVRKRIMVKPKGGGKAVWRRVTDERELRELIGRNAAILERNATLRLMPEDWKEEIVERCIATVQRESEEAVAQDAPMVAKKILAAFATIGVEREDLERFLGYELEKIRAKDRTDLLAIYESITNGHNKAADYFAAEGDEAPDEPTEGSAEVGLQERQVTAKELALEEPVVCSGRKADGSPCERKTTNPSGYCPSHKDQAEAAAQPEEKPPKKEPEGSRKPDPPAPGPATGAQLKQIRAAVEAQEMDEDELQRALRNLYDADNVEELSGAQAADLIQAIADGSVFRRLEGWRG